MKRVINTNSALICKEARVLLIRNTTDLNVGVHFLDLKIFLGSKLIYEETVLFRIRPFSLVELDAHTAVEPIVPGEMFLAVEIMNYGSYTEVINFSVEGSIPENFIYKGFYPDDFIDGSAQH